jgi:pimeloyl-ACP methyl ester carboxylesterase
MVTETDLTLADGRSLHVYDTHPGADGRLAVFWHHGTPNTGAPPEPLFAAADELGLRWVSYDRPSYGTSAPQPGRNVAAAAATVAEVANRLGIGPFAVMGHSGGGPHALACGALLPSRVLAVVSGSGMAPFGAAGLDWFAGMRAGGQGELRAALAGRAELARFLAEEEFDPEMFTPADLEALSGEWAWLGQIAGQAAAAGPAGQIDDNLAYVAPWGFTPEQISVPVLLLHGDQDRMVPSTHARWLAGVIRHPQLWLVPGEGHVSVLRSGADALRWLREQADAGGNQVSS